MARASEELGGNGCRGWYLWYALRSLEYKVKRRGHERNGHGTPGGCGYIGWLGKSLHCRRKGFSNPVRSETVVAQRGRRSEIGFCLLPLVNHPPYAQRRLALELPKPPLTRTPHLSPLAKLARSQVHHVTGTLLIARASEANSGCWFKTKSRSAHYAPRICTQSDSRCHVQRVYLIAMYDLPIPPYCTVTTPLRSIPYARTHTPLA